DIRHSSRDQTAPRLHPCRSEATFLDLLIAARDDEPGERMTDQQLRDEVMTIFLAGHETTANALSWTLLLLSEHPAVARTFRSELAQVLGQRAPNVEDLPRLLYTGQVIQEAMRLYPRFGCSFDRCRTTMRSVVTTSRDGPT